MNGILLIFLFACIVLVLCGSSYLYDAVCRWIECWQQRSRRRQARQSDKAARIRAEAECETLRAENAKLRRTMYVLRADAESQIDLLERELEEKNMLLAQKWAGSKYKKEA